ncbi:unnamed protein product [Choristocarpus tenellus]
MGQYDDTSLPPELRSFMTEDEIEEGVEQLKEKEKRDRDKIAAQRANKCKARMTLQANRREEEKDTGTCILLEPSLRVVPVLDGEGTLHSRSKGRGMYFRMDEQWMRGTVTKYQPRYTEPVGEERVSYPYEVKWENGEVRNINLLQELYSTEANAEPRSWFWTSPT